MRRELELRTGAGLDGVSDRDQTTADSRNIHHGLPPPTADGPLWRAPAPEASPCWIERIRPAQPWGISTALEAVPMRISCRRALDAEADVTAALEQLISGLRLLPPGIFCWISVIWTWNPSGPRVMNQIALDGTTQCPV